ncbi:MAG: hypothetical protein ORN49_13115 [Rhodobacteraceae bacterium]|nr:hypothetical protein [Paracoccaceae bacterium]
MPSDIAPSHVSPVIMTSRADRKSAALERETGPLPLLVRPKGHVVICAQKARGLAAKGKMNPQRFLPDFLPALASFGIQPHFAFRPAQISELIARHDAAAIAVWNEEKHRACDPDFREAAQTSRLLFNSFTTGERIGSKAETNRWLTARGIRMPAMTSDTSGPVFSNAPQGSSQPVSLLSAGSPLDPGRYNTRYIDTQVDFAGQSYLTTVRLLAVGPFVVAAFVGARDLRWQRAAVHGVDTPMNAALVNFLYDRLYLSRQAEFAAIARRLHDILGPGFYHHDLIVARETGEIHLCEVGFKFDASAFADHMRPIAADVPYLQPFYTDEFARNSARAFHDSWQEAMQP